MASMRTTLTRLGMRQARRHPRAAMKTGLLAARHPRRTRRLFRIAGLAQRAPQMAQQRSTRRHLKAAAVSASRARTRARRIGSPAAAADERVLRNMAAAVRESAEAYRSAAARERRRRRARRLAFGASAVAAGAWMGRRRMADSSGGTH